MEIRRLTVSDHLSRKREFIGKPPALVIRPRINPLNLMNRLMGLEEKSNTNSRASDVFSLGRLSLKNHKVKILTPKGIELDPKLMEGKTAKEIDTIALKTDEIINTDEYIEEKKKLIEAIKERKAKVFQFASAEYQADREIALEAFKVHVWLLKFASFALRSDRDFMHEAIKQKGESFKFAAESLRENKDFILDAIKLRASIFLLLPSKFKSDVDIALEAVRQNGWILKYAPKDLRSNKEVVLEAVKQWDRAIKYASANLRVDKDIRKAAGLK